jgi:ribosomal protein S18 acetylase RimI-like enzyme
VTALEVAPTHRRRGLAVAVMAALAAWAAEQSVRRMYLQVADANAAALGLYRRLGFGRHHRYRYRLAPVDAGSPPDT